LEKGDGLRPLKARFFRDALECDPVKACKRIHTKNPGYLRNSKTQRGMKKIITFLLLLTAACSPGIVVQTDYDQEVNIKPYSTYTWADSKEIEVKNNPLYYNELNDKRIKTAVEEQLKKKGYTPATGPAELVIHYHLVVENQTELRTDPYGFYGPYWLRPGISSYRYSEGTLIIDIMEAKTNNLAWRGWATSITDSNRAIKEELIQLAVQEIFKKYPHRAGK
jgi:hypothetical protein